MRLWWVASIFFFVVGPTAAEAQAEGADATMQRATVPVAQDSPPERASGSDQVAEAVTSPPSTPEPSASAAPSTLQIVPFGWGDFTWMNGQNRQRSFPLAFSPIVTLSAYLDVYYLYSLHHPLDNTLTGTGATGRHNEFQINLASIGLDFNYQNVIARLAIQYGGILELVQNLDGSVRRGRSLTTDALRYIREFTLGMRIDELEGINIEAGIFMSYIGLESYLLAENWNYTRSLVCDHTAFYFQGVRAQFFLHNLKIEPWIMNGWQSYGRWNYAPSAGLAIRWQPFEEFALLSNFYVGTDTRGMPNRVRFHHDHSILYRYWNDPSGPLNRLAFSVNNHIGFEDGGGGPTFEEAHMFGTSIAHRASFAHDLFHITLRFEYMTNPTRYLAQYPPPGFASGSGTKLEIFGVTATLEVMPRDFFSIRAEVVYRTGNAPYFAGPGGTTSPDGFIDTPGPFVPDTRNDQTSFLVSSNFRL